MRCKVGAKVAPRSREVCAAGLLLSLFRRSGCRSISYSLGGLILRSVLTRLLSVTTRHKVVRGDVNCHSLFSAGLVGALVPHPTRIRRAF